MNTLITGVAGFIGYHLAQRLTKEGDRVYGIDNLNDYYNVNLKKARLDKLLPHPNFTFQYLDIADRTVMSELFQQQKFDRVIHLAAQAGVRYSITNSHAYADSNLVGFTNILEGCRHAEIEHLIFASSSSVYGTNTKIPFSVEDNVDRPISFYAATKKANELMAHCYSHLYQIPTTGLRFFTVYGEWGRPDMAYYKFVEAIDLDRPIDVYNFGKLQRDFTYIDDIIEGLVRVANKPPQPQENAPYKIYNVGNNKPVELLTFIEVIEEAMGKKAQKNFLPMQAGDVFATYADIDDLIRDTGFQPSTSIEVGINNFVRWYRNLEF
jgi:UDP-glucuronate 4-epimerase